MAGPELFIITEFDCICNKLGSLIVTYFIIVYLNIKITGLDWIILKSVFLPRQNTETVLLYNSVRHLWLFC